MQLASFLFALKFAETNQKSDYLKRLSKKNKAIRNSTGFVNKRSQNNPIFA